MKSRCLALALLIVIVAPLGRAADTPAAPADKSAGKSAPASRRFPLRGLITAVDQERSALMVKHEEIPGVMHAMTMMFKVDAATLKRVEKGQAITAMLSREGTEWWLHDVKVVPAKKTKD